MPKVLFLSPHLDDAVFSCAVQILRERQAGNDVMVATVFSHARRNSTASATYVDRRAEDRRALNILGAQVRWLGLLDAPCRNPFYNSFRRIVLETAPGDERTAKPVETALTRVIDDFRPTTVYAPLGVGTHIDHRLVYSAVAALAEKRRVNPAQLRYYEERPYAYIRGAVALRLSQLGIKSRQEPLRTLSVFLQSFRRAPYVSRYLPPGPERLDVERILAESGNTRIAGIPKASLCPCRLVVARGNERETVLRAIRAYVSQIDDFLGNDRHFRQREKRHAASLGSTHWRAERYWTQKGAV
jgi:LmbE family N-acetylglucosaminyl deacetylase